MAAAAGFPDFPGHPGFADSLPGASLAHDKLDQDGDEAAMTIDFTMTLAVRAPGGVLRISVSTYLGRQGLQLRLVKTANDPLCFARRYFECKLVLEVPAIARFDLVRFHNHLRKILQKGAMYKGMLKVTLVREK
ncbi:Hypothetical Protein FCC1311_000972 [Hondaea fermentalgiana]|uniref:Uncharacterized protein n=1 Tax=Hondaea fermentalgiana TaxID=2315210 RepID=A0A2R5G2C4_9STRA|nr:Hypothetical Protein FCC1311_000972 [Hondaea fermentalgiana]|eukprot:GBG23878.1 Hypothetical Protein FCC1311_000972 [Hondaea fermentalgiana]